MRQCFCLCLYTSFSHSARLLPYESVRFSLPSSLLHFLKSQYHIQDIFDNNGLFPCNVVYFLNVNSMINYRSIFFIFFLAFSCTLDIIFINLLRSSRVYTWRGFLVQRYESYFIEISWFFISYCSHHCSIKTSINVETFFVAGHKEIHFAKPYVFFICRICTAIFHLHV